MYRHVFQAILDRHLLLMLVMGAALTLAAEPLMPTVHSWVATAPAQDCGTVREALSRQWRADSTKVTAQVEAVRNCYLEQGERDWASLTKAQADTLLRIYQIGIRFEPERRAHWLSERALLGTLRNADYKPMARKWLMEAILANPEDPSLFFFVSALVRIEGEYLKGQLALGEVVADWMALDRLLMFHEVCSGPDSDPFAALHERYRLKFKDALPDCKQIGSMYADRITAKTLPADSCKTYLTLYELQGCDAHELWQAALETALQASDEAGLRRMAGAEAYNREAWEESRQHWQQAIRLEHDPRLQAADHLQVAQTLLAQDDHRLARTSILAAMQLHPDWGEPIVRLMDLYLDGNLRCNGSQFEQRAIYWLLIDLCHELLQADPNYAVQANERLYNYRSLAPSLGEAAIRGFKPGDTYPFKCWMSTTTTIPLD